MYTQVELAIFLSNVLMYIKNYEVPLTYSFIFKDVNRNNKFDD